MSLIPLIEELDRDPIIIKFSKTIMWEFDWENALKRLSEKYLNEMYSKRSSRDYVYWQLERFDTINGYKDTMAVSDIELTGFLLKASRIAFASFWAPAAFVYRLATSLYYVGGSVVKRS